MNVEIKVAILRSGLKGYEVAAKLSWPPSKISAIINGSHNPTLVEKNQLAEVLAVTISEIFPHSTVIA